MTLSKENDVYDITENDVVVFDNIVLNSGNSHDTNTGKFVCPIDEVYFFTWTALSDSKNDFSSELAINGVPFIFNIVDNDLTEDHMSSTASLTVKFVRGDEVWIRGHGKEGKYLHSTWTNGIPVTVFTGFRL